MTAQPRAAGIVALLLLTGAAPPGGTAVIGVLDKRMGTATEFSVAPGGRFRFGRLSGVVQTCAHSSPWEQPARWGAFVQVVETPRPRTRTDKPAPRTIFSGWLFGHSPSLNALQHPVYDVWVKSCTMAAPDGPKPPTSGGSSTAGARSPSGGDRSIATEARMPAAGGAVG